MHRDFWVAGAGCGEETATWPLDGTWTFVVMIAEASRGVVADVAASVTIPGLSWVVAILLSVGLTSLLVAIPAAGGAAPATSDLEPAHGDVPRPGGPLRVSLTCPSADHELQATPGLVDCCARVPELLVGHQSGERREASSRQSLRRLPGPGRRPGHRQARCPYTAPSRRRRDPDHVLPGPLVRDQPNPLGQPSRPAPA